MEKLRADTNRILRRRSVQERVGLGRSSLYVRIKQGLFPQPVKLGGGQLVGWPENEIAAINGARIAGKTDSEIRILVRELEAIRATHCAEL
jgi:prophage regulatory protein